MRGGNGDELREEMPEWRWIIIQNTSKLYEFYLPSLLSTSRLIPMRRFFDEKGKSCSQHIRIRSSSQSCSWTRSNTRWSSTSSNRQVFSFLYWSCRLFPPPWGKFKVSRLLRFFLIAEKAENLNFHIFFSYSHVVKTFDIDFLLFLAEKWEILLCCRNSQLFAAANREKRSERAEKSEFKAHKVDWRNLYIYFFFAYQLIFIYSSPYVLKLIIFLSLYPNFLISYFSSSNRSHFIIHFSMHIFLLKQILSLYVLLNMHVLRSVSLLHCAHISRFIDNFHPNYFLLFPPSIHVLYRV